MTVIHYCLVSAVVGCLVINVLHFDYHLRIIYHKSVLFDVTREDAGEETLVSLYYFLSIFIFIG